MKKIMLRSLAAALIAVPVAIPVALVAMKVVGALSGCPKTDTPIEDFFTE